MRAPPRSPLTIFFVPASSPAPLALSSRNAWLAELQMSGASPHTLSGYRRLTSEALTHIAALHGTSLEKLRLSSITRDDVASAMAAYQSRPDARSGAATARATSTLHRFYSCLHSFFAWCVTTEKIAKNPVAKIKAPKVPSRVPKAMSKEECELLLATASRSAFPERDTLALLLTLTAGLRLAEIAGLTLSSIIYQDGALTHLLVLGKGNKERVVPTNERLNQALDAYLPERATKAQSLLQPSEALLLSQRGPFSRDGLSQLFDTLVKRAGLKVPGRRVHACRHSFATHVLAAGADILSVSELMGHSSVSTTQVYLRVDPARLSAAVAASPLAQV